MTADLKDLMDRAVAGLALPPQLAQTVARRAERGSRRRRRAAAALVTVALAACGLIVWVVVGPAGGSNTSTVTPASPSPAAVPSGVVIPPAGRRPAPALSGNTLNGSPFSLATLRGEVVVVNFWGSWCAPCRAQLPVLQHVYSATQAGGVTFIGVDERDTQAGARSFVTKAGVGYESVFDGDGKLAASWPAANGPPYTLVVDRLGRIAALFPGSVSATQLQGAVARVAAETPPETVETVTRHEWFPYGQASLDPPAARQAPADPASAWARIAARLPSTLCQGATRMTVQFGLFTNYLVVTTNPLRYAPYDYNKVPEWVVRCADVVKPPPIGPAGLGPSPKPSPTAAKAPDLIDQISVFDARTGRLLIGFDDTAS